MGVSQSLERDDAECGMHPGRDKCLDLPVLIVVHVEHLRPQDEIEEPALPVLAQLAAKAIEAVLPCIAIGTRLVEMRHEATREIQATQLLRLLLRDAKLSHHTRHNASLEATQGICLAWTMGIPFRSFQFHRTFFFIKDEKWSIIAYARNL